MARVTGAPGNRTIRLNPERVAQARTDRGFSRPSLSQAAQGANPISKETIKRAEQGKPVLLDRARSLALVLNVPLSWLLAPGVAPLSSCEELARPRLAVRPPEVLGDGDDAEAFTQGLAADLTSRVARWWFPVLSADSARNTKDAVAPAELGADYVVSGTVQRVGGRVHLNVHLTDTASGLTLWGETYDKPFDSVLAVQRTVTEAVVSGVSGAILDATTQRFEHLEPEDLSAWEQALLGVWLFNRRNVSDNAKARTVLAGAVRRHSRIPVAWYTLSLAYQQDLVNQWTHDPQGSLQAMAGAFSELERLYPSLPETQITGAYLNIYQGQRQAAMDRLAAAIAVDPNSCIAYGLYGQTLAMDGNPDEAFQQFDQALALSPLDPERCSIHTGIALSHFVAEDYEETVASARLAIRLRPSLPFPYGVLASAQALRGNRTEARAALAQIPSAGGGMRRSGLDSVIKSTRPEIAKRFLHGLELAGVAG